MNKKHMEWFRDAKYGMFIHWGLYSILGGSWKGERIPYGTEWIMRNAKIPLSEYKDLVNQFNPEEFDANQWVEIAKKNGMKYIVFTAKHHDGFAMYNSKYSDYTIMHTPFGRDVLKELSVACERHNMVLCIYYSQMQDWEDPNADGNTWDYPNTEQKDFRYYFNNKVKPQVKELLEGYGKIGIMWFDTPYDMPKELCKELEDWVHECQPGCIINGRIGYGYGDYRQMSDNGIPVLGFDKDWETPMTLNDTWGYSKSDENWKSPKVIMNMLIDIAGKGGNFLLNVGPDSKGCIPHGSQKVLNVIGDWLKKNGESIYGTICAPDFPYQLYWGGFTYKKSLLYMHVLNYPTFPYEICVVGLNTKVKRAYLSQTGEDIPYYQSYEYARDENRLRVILPSQPIDELNTVVILELEEAPTIQNLDMYTK